MLESNVITIFLEHLRARCQGMDLDIVRWVNRSRPDYVILGPNGRWAAVEFKVSERSPKRPNQEYHIQRLDHNGYARFVHKNNILEVVDEIEKLFSS